VPEVSARGRTDTTEIYDGDVTSIWCETFDLTAMTGLHERSWTEVS